MRFGAPLQFVWLLVVPVLITAWVVGLRWRKRALETFGELPLVQKLARSVNWRRRVIRLCLLLAGLVFLVLALTRPQFGMRMETVFRRGVDIVVALDVSQSMLAKDIAPNRLEKAKSEIASLINRLQGDRIGIVAFAGVAYLQCPLTVDYGAAKLFLELVDTNLIPRPGTAIGEAIRTSVSAFDQKDLKHKVLILITDGEDHASDPMGAAEAAKAAGVKIFALGIGKTKGEPIPDPNGGYKKDRSGKVVMTRLDVATLQKISAATGGRFHHATKSEIELDAVYNEVQQMEKKELFSKKLAHYEDRYQFPLAFALFFLVLESLFSDRSRSKEEWGGRFA